MDTLTHALTGALLGRASAGRADPLPLRRRLTVGLLASAFPDSDALMALWLDPLRYLNAHRGITHSLLLLPLWALLLALLFAALYRDRRAGRLHWRPYAVLSALVLLVHIGMDVITSYGTGILAPFSDYKASWATSFIIDPWFTGLVLLGLLLSRVWRGSRRPALVVLVLLAGYVGMQAVLKLEAQALAQRHAAQAGWAPLQVQALPQPLSPFHWKLLVRTADGYRIAAVNLIREVPAHTPADAGTWDRVMGAYAPPGALAWRRVAPFGGASAGLVREAWNAPTFEEFRRFAVWPALSSLERRGAGTCVWFEDLRFTVPGLDRSPFEYGLCRSAPDAPWRPFRAGDQGAEPIA